MLGHMIVSQHFMEPEGSIPNSQELSTCSYPEPDQSGPHHPIPPLQDPSKYYPSTFVLVFLVVSFPLAFPPIIYKRFSSPHSCYMTRLSHPPRLDYSNYTWRRVQIMKLLVMQLGSLSPQHGASSGCGWRNGLQIWRLAANILNKQSWTDNKGWPSSFGGWAWG
jgi:hypothetical protein